MGIVKVDMYTAECDNCGVHAEFGDYSCYADKSSVEEDATSQGWYFTDLGDKCYCEECKSEFLI